MSENLKALRTVGVLRQDRLPANRLQPDKRTASYSLIWTPDASELMERAQQATGKEFITAKDILSTFDRGEEKSHLKHPRAPDGERGETQTEAPPCARLRGVDEMKEQTEAPPRSQQVHSRAQFPAPPCALNTEEHAKEHQAANTRSVSAHTHAHEAETGMGILDKHLSDIGEALDEEPGLEAGNDQCVYCGATLKRYGTNYTACSSNCASSLKPGNHADGRARGKTA